MTPARSSTRVTGWRCSATSISVWSKARLRNVEYTATTGCRPAIASPAAEVTACCSAMPTSNQRSGNASAKVCRPVERSIAAVIATTSSRSAPMRVSSSENTDVQLGPLAGGFPVAGSTGSVWCIWSASWLTAGG